MKKYFLFYLLAILFNKGIAFGQLPVEFLVGNNKNSIDIMFFKFIKNKNQVQSPFLFFNRNRMSIGNPINSKNNLPQFGFTNALSYNNVKLKGFAPVFVLQSSSTGLFSKAGVQFAYLKPTFLLFSWVVLETNRNPYLDVFFMGRYNPKISEKLNLFIQAEFFNALNSHKSMNNNFTQRFRLGLQQKQFQYGLGIDLTEFGKTSFTSTTNTGLFIRYDFN